MKKQKTQIGEVGISNEEDFSYAIRFLKLVLALLYAVSVWLRIAVK